MSREAMAAGTKVETEYLQKDHVMIVRFRGFEKTEEIKQDILMLNKAIREQGVQGMMVNYQDAKAFSAEIQSIITKSAAGMSTNGVKKVAVILPEDVFALSAIRKIHNNVTGTNVNLFASEPEGINWLRTF